MKLYHYSKEKYNDIRSQVAQGKVEATDNPKQYGKSVSFFMEKIPLNIGEIWHNEHKFWRSGEELYEYEVDTNSLPADILFVIAETPEKVALLYGSQKWYDGMPDELIQSNKKEIADMELSKGYLGEGRIKLVKACKSIPKGLAKYYEKSYKLSGKFPEDKIQEKYAACVPHLMIYPSEKIIKFDSVEQITLT